MLGRIADEAEADFLTLFPEGVGEPEIVRCNLEPGASSRGYQKGLMLRRPDGCWAMYGYRIKDRYWFRPFSWRRVSHGVPPNRSVI